VSLPYKGIIEMIAVRREKPWAAAHVSSSLLAAALRDIGDEWISE
jgi:hypothetical protein